MAQFAVIFDMDGVVVDNHTYHANAWRIFAKKHGFTMTEEQFREKVNGRTINEVIAEIFEDKQLSQDDIRKLGEEKEALYRKIYSDEVKPIDGLPQFLEHLHQQHIPVALATSSPPVNVDFILSKTRLHRYFHTILDATSFKKGKPDPEIYIKAGKALNMPSAQCIVFEDSMSGLGAAQRAGMRVIALATTHKTSELQHIPVVIQDYMGFSVENLKAMLQKI